VALVPQIVDAVRVPVIAAGGIADGRGIAAAFALGASGVQMGTAFLGCPETTISPSTALNCGLPPTMRPN
jgi:nitronate monooxygenase